MAATSLFSFALLRSGTAIGQTAEEPANRMHRGGVDRAALDCTEVARSCFNDRTCYDQAKRFTLIDLNGTCFRHRTIDQAKVDCPPAAGSMGKDSSKAIGGTGEDGPFICRTHHVPK